MVNRTFDLFHLSLTPRQDPKLFSSGMPREQWLREALKGGFQFVHRLRTFFWVPQPGQDKYIVGFVQRSAPRRQHLPPERGGGEIVSQEWQGALVVIDPTHHDDGQKMSFERDGIIGQALPIALSLAYALNGKEDAPYFIEVNPLLREADFWAFAKRNGDRLKYISFQLVVPNMHGTEKELEKELEDLKKKGVEKVGYKLSGRDGIDALIPQIEASVAHCRKGGGSFRAAATSGEVFRSHSAQTTTSIPADEFDETLQDRRPQATLLKRIMGNE